MRIKLPQPATVISIVAVCLAAGGTATAATMITGKQIKNGSITGSDVKRGSLTMNHMSSAARRGMDRGPAGAIGPAGPAGPAGPVGPAGPAGPAGALRALTRAAENVTVLAADGSKSITAVALTTGRYVLDAKLNTNSNDGFRCLLSADGATLDFFESNTAEQAILQGEIDVSGPARQGVRLTCESDSSLFIESADLRALQVDSLE